MEGGKEENEKKKEADAMAKKFFDAAASKASRRSFDQSAAESDTEKEFCPMVAREW